MNGPNEKISLENIAVAGCTACKDSIYDAVTELIEQKAVKSTNAACRAVAEAINAQIGEEIYSQVRVKCIYYRGKKERTAAPVNEIQEEKEVQVKAHTRSLPRRTEEDTDILTDIMEGIDIEDQETMKEDIVERAAQILADKLYARIIGTDQEVE